MEMPLYDVVVKAVDECEIGREEGGASERQNILALSEILLNANCIDD